MPTQVWFLAPPPFFYDPPSPVASRSARSNHDAWPCWRPQALYSAVPDSVTFIEAHVEDIALGTNHPDGAGKDRTGAAQGTRRGTAFGTVRQDDAQRENNTADRNTTTNNEGGSWQAEFDLLVGADGSDSSVRHRVMQMSLESETTAPGGREEQSTGRGGEASGSGDGGQSSPPAMMTGERDATVELASPKRRGYTVYRGVVSKGGGSSSSGAKDADADADIAGQGEGGGDEMGWGLESFQTWGPGLRFASVPLAGDERVRNL